LRGKSGNKKAGAKKINPLIYAMRLCKDPTGGLLDDVNSVPEYLTCLSYALVLILLWYFIKINFIIRPEGLTPGPSGPYSGDLVELPSGSLDDLEATPQMVQETIWGDMTPDAAVKYKGRPAKTWASWPGGHEELYGATGGRDGAADEVRAEIVPDIAQRDGYAGGRGLSHREGLDNPDGDIDGDFMAYDIRGTRTNAPRQPLPVSRPTSGMYGDVPVLLYNNADTQSADQWGLGSDKLYLFNSYSYNEDGHL
jgi:hypothetical protein